MNNDKEKKNGMNIAERFACGLLGCTVFVASIIAKRGSRYKQMMLLPIVFIVVGSGFIVMGLKNYHQGYFAHGIMLALVGAIILGVGNFFMNIIKYQPKKELADEMSPKGEEF